MSVVCAFDEGPGIGLGHRRRVESLARELAALGVQAELRLLGDEPVKAGVVLVDSYRVRADDTERIRAVVTIAIDDLERDLDVDLAVDPDPGADPRVHARAGTVLAGAPYALVDPALLRWDTKPVQLAVQRILVTAGAADANGVAGRIAVEIADTLPSVEVRLIVGPWGNAVDDARVVAVAAPDGLAAELAAADVVVTAGGVTMLESCCLGRPTVAFSIADDQGRALAGAAQVGAVLAADRTTAAGVAVRLAGDDGARRRLAASARTLIDGQGASRVASVVASMSRQGTHAR